MTEAAHVKCRACGIEYGQERRHGTTWPPACCGQCGSKDISLGDPPVIKVVQDELDGQLFRIVRTSKTDAYVEAQGPFEKWTATDDETAARVYLAAYLELFDGIGALAEKARPTR